MERVFDELLWRYGYDGIVEVAHLDGRQRDVLDSTVGTSFAYCYPVALAHHIVACKTYACHKSRNGVLEYEHKHSRCGTESGEKGERTAVDDDRNDDNDAEKQHDNLQYSAEGMQILLGGGAFVVVIVEEFERADKGCHQSHCGDGDVYGGSLKYEALYYRVGKEDGWHEHPHDNGWYDIARCPDSLRVKQIVVPYNIGVAYYTCGQWRHHFYAQQVGKPCNECYTDA